VADLTNLDDIGIPTAQAVRPASQMLSTSQGKAPTLVAAKVSAAMESLESWHSENLLPVLRNRSARELGDELTYDPAMLPQQPGSLYHPDAKLDWVPATTVVTGRPTWLPYLAVLINVTLRERWGPPLFVMDSNGLASGNTYDEAALHGIYELLERDSRFQIEQSGRVRWLDPDTVDDPGCRRLIEQIRQAGNDAEIFDCTTWDGYPCFDVNLRSRALGGLFGGTGLHHDPAVALSRGLTEAAQSRLTVISGAREDILSTAYYRFGQPAEPPPPIAELSDFPSAPQADSRTVRQLVIDAARAITERVGSEPIATVVDFPLAAVPVVRVLAPTLRYAGHTDIRAALPGATE